MSDQNPPSPVSEGTVKPIYIERDPTPQPPASWWAGIAAANRTAGGSFVMLLVGLGVGFLWGYWTKYKSYQADGIQIVTQALNNESIDNAATAQMQQRSDELAATLQSLGYSQSEVQLLLKGDVSTLDKIKDKVNRVVNRGDVYTPREDCVDDYLGRDASDRLNESILKQFEDKPGGK